MSGIGKSEISQTSWRTAVDDEKILGSDVAGLTDRILAAQDKPQRFGTQFKTVNGKIVIWRVGDVEHLEQRRARYLLPPMSVYRKTLSDMYYMPVQRSLDQLRQTVSIA
jgi:hypothetical protein